MKKNDLVQLEITDYGTNGEGIGRAEGFPLFINGAVIGDTIEARITLMKKSYGYGHLEQVLKPSPERIAPRCPVARTCGGCQLQAMSYEGQLRYKERKVREDLKRIGGIDTDPAPILGMEDPWHYRNKAQFPIDETLPAADRQLGFYAIHSHRIVPCAQCAINMDGLNRLAGAFINRDIPGLRHILVRKAHKTGETMACLVTRKPITAEALPVPPGLTSLSCSVNDSRDNVILGEHYHVLSGKDHIVDMIGDLAFEISPLSFYQVNPVQTEKLYRTVLSYAGLTGTEVVWDLYCGTGTIGLFLARSAAHVYGVEVVPAAIENAQRNALENHIGNADFYVGKAEEVAPALPAPQVIVADPPRKGCDPKLIQTILKAAPDRIVYVSCNPATLARDLKLLTEGAGTDTAGNDRNPCIPRYRIERVQPVDMFPHTVHVECVVLMSRVKA